AHSTQWNAYFGIYSSVAPLRLTLVSDFCRTPFRASSDTIPMVPENCPASARNTVRYQSERCPAKIGTLSDRNWNQCPTALGIRIAQQSTPGTNYSVIQRGPHAKVWQRVTWQTNAGRAFAITNKYTQLATGMH